MPDDFFNCYSYLERFWPKDPKSDPKDGKVWEDTRWLLSEYIAAAKLIKKHSSQKRKNLDISTGPALAPVIPFTPVIAKLQLTDYSKTNRKILQEIDIDYWKKYAEEIIAMEGEKTTHSEVDKRLNWLDKLRKQSKPIKVDITRDKLFYPKIDSSKFNLLTMHFVPDSITDSKKKYCQMLGRIINLLTPDDMFVMSALVECSTWDDGVSEYRSPNIKLKRIIAFLERNSLLILRAKQFIPPETEGHDGGIAVITAKLR